MQASQQDRENADIQTFSNVFLHTPYKLGKTGSNGIDLLNLSRHVWQWGTKIEETSFGMKVEPLRAGRQVEARGPSISSSSPLFSAQSPSRYTSSFVVRPMSRGARGKLQQDS